MIYTFKISVLNTSNVMHYSCNIKTSSTVVLYYAITYTALAREVMQSPPSVRLSVSTVIFEPSDL